MLNYRSSAFLHLAVAPLALAVLPSACQHVPPEVGPGVRIRISAPEVSSKRLVGEVESVVADTLVLKLDGGDAISTVPFTTVERIDVSRGSIPGNAVFMLAGYVLGAGVGIAEVSRNGCDPACFPSYLAAGGILGLVGLGAGWLISAPFFRIERWESVPPENLRVSIYPTNSGVALAFSVNF